MAITLYSDLLEGSYLERQGGTILRATRAFLADGITVTPEVSGRDPLVLVRALTESSGLPAWGDGHPGDNTCKVSKHRVVGIKNDQARILVDYERPDFGFPAQQNTFLIRDSTTLVQRPTQRIRNGSNQVKHLRVSWHERAHALNKVPEDTLTINPYFPMRVVTLSTIVDGRVQIGSWHDFTRKVNADTWFGYPKGFWLCMGLDAEVSQLDANNPANSQMRVSISFISQVDEPWMHDGILRNQQDGKYVKVDQQDIDDIEGQGYVNDVIYPQGGAGGARNYGILSAGPYKIANFSSAFPVGAGGLGGGGGSIPTG